jgi:hypothetical protein
MPVFLPERSRHIDMQHFAILDWKAAGDIILHHIPSSINPADDLTKPLGYILHYVMFVESWDITAPKLSFALYSNDKIIFQVRGRVLSYRLLMDRQRWMMNRRWRWKAQMSIFFSPLPILVNAFVTTWYFLATLEVFISTDGHTQSDHRTDAS